MTQESLTSRSKDTSVDVYLVAKNQANKPLKLSMQDANGNKVSDIDFYNDQKTINFHFPDSYVAEEIRVFEDIATEQKSAIMAAYNISKEVGFRAFDAQWKGNASDKNSSGKREFKVTKQKDNLLSVEDKDFDGGTAGTEHSFILKFTYGTTGMRIAGLYDPKIRNKTR